MTKPAGIQVFTFKDGLLARLAHDLQLTAQRYDITLRGGDLNVRVDSSALRVDGAVVRGALAPTLLSEGDRKRIDATMHDEILRVSAHPELTLQATVHHGGGARFTVRGELQLRGRTQAVEIPLTLDRGVHGRFDLVPSRFGVEPYRALAGALKVQDRVTVSIELPAADLGLSAAGWANAECHWGGSGG